MIRNDAETDWSGNPHMDRDEMTVEEQLRQRTAELEAALRENERISSALRESEQKFHRLVERSLVGISLSDGHRFVYVNPKFAEITGYSVDELLHMGPLDILAESDRSQAEDMLLRGLNDEFAGNFSTVINIQRKDGTVALGELTGGPSVDVDGKPAVIAMIEDITDKIRADDKIRLLNGRLWEQAVRDPLTDLFNRRYFEESLAREIHNAKRHGQTLGLVMGDLDHFKNVNDSCGHQAGDKVLRAFADLMRQYSRGSDVPCRYGGEEFLLLLPGINEDKARERAELLRSRISAVPVECQGKVLHVSASFGVAVFPWHAKDTDSLIAVVDRAMYQAKAAGRNRVCCAGVAAD